MTWIKSTVQSAALVALSFGLALSLAEVSLRMLGVGYSNNPLDADHQVHHIHPRNFSYLVYDPYGEYGGHKVYYNGDGYRISGQDETPTNRQGRRIVFLGDSFTEAVQVAWKDSFVGQIQSQNPDVTVYNLGVSSFAPLIYLVQAREVVKKLQPTDIVLQIYSNDLSDDLEYLKQANNQDLEEITAIDGGKTSFALRLMRHSYLARLVKKTYVELSMKRGNLPDRDLAQSFYNPIIPERSLTLDALQKIQTLADTMGAKLHVFVIPNKSLAMESRCCRDDSFAKGMMARLKAVNIPVIDMSLAFEAAADQPKLFFKRDIHLTTNGHVVVADTLSKALGLR